MDLTHRSRAEQKAKAHSTLSVVHRDIDSVLDGVDVPRPMYSKNWALESRVHRSVKLTNDVRTTRNFVGPQANIVRDDLRKATYAIHIEGDNHHLVLTEIRSSKVVKQTLIDDLVWRAHIALDKFSGEIHTLYIKRVGDHQLLFIDGIQVETEGTQIDFPFLCFSQLPIGHIPSQPASFLMMTYKCRETRRIYYRTVNSDKHGKERILLEEETVGGAPLIAIGKKVVFHVNLLNGDGYQPAVIQSNNSGASLSEVDVIDLSTGLGASVEYQPHLASPIVDYSGMVHVPVNVTSDGASRLIDVSLVDFSATDVIEIIGSEGLPSGAALAPFPKTVCNTRVQFDEDGLPIKDDWRFGDGITDGVGIIGVFLQSGDLFTSNSQSGGAMYPEKKLLNHEMLDIATFATTQCYTAGVTPNMVSMDYLYLEAIEKTQPMSGELHLETWDMPLPIPEGKAVQIDKTTIELTILNNGNFLPGGTSVNIDVSVGNIAQVTLTGERTAVVKVDLLNDTEELKGHTLRIESKNIFYHHAFNLKIE